MASLLLPIPHPMPIRPDMKKTPADLMYEATRLTLTGDAAGAAAMFQAALSGQQPDERDTVIVTPPTGDDDSDPASTPSALAASFNEAVFSHDGAELPYKLFIPARQNDDPAPLLLMLHGCGQDAQDFATGTRMNEIAQASGMMVLYPTQSASANPNRCWNWFEPEHQHRGGGEPAALSALTRHILQTQSIDPQRLFVAGFSAGGSMALILTEQYPELFAAAGVHSCLPTGAASSAMDAFRLMQNATIETPDTSGEPSSETRKADSSSSKETPDSSPNPPVQFFPLIVFHGSLDRTVNRANAERIIINWLAREKSRKGSPRWRPLSLPHTTASGCHCTVTTYVAEDQPDRSGCEYWQLSQGSHHWAGGSPDGSYTDKNGPDASSEMVRFFLECLPD